MSDRRDYARFCPNQPKQVTFRDSYGTECTAAVLNESLGGMALACAAECVMVPGTTISVSYLGAPLPAIVWHCRSDGEGTIVFGIEWLE